MKFFDTRHLALIFSFAFFLVSTITKAQTCFSSFDELSVDIMGEMQGGDGYIDASFALTEDGDDGPFTFELTGTGQTGYFDINSTGLFDFLLADTYSLLVADGTDCSFGPFQYTVEAIPCDPSFFSVGAVFTTEESGAGFDGEIDAGSAVTGQGPYVFNLYNQSQDFLNSNGSGIFGGLSGGSYLMDVVDQGAGNCLSNLETITVGGPVCEQPFVDAFVFQDNQNCVNPNGALDISVSPGSYTPYAGYSIEVTSGQGQIYFDSQYDGSLITLTSLSGDNYTIQVTDNYVANCTTTENITVLDNQDFPVISGVAITHETGSGLNDGVLDATGSVSGGSFNYSYEWYDDQSTLVGSTEMISNLAPGNYSLIVVDTQTGCVSNEEFYTINAFTETFSNTAGNYEGNSGSYTGSFDGSSGDAAAYQANLAAAIKNAIETSGEGVIDLSGLNITNGPLVLQLGLNPLTSGLQIIGPGPDLLTLIGSSPVITVNTKNTGTTIVENTTLSNGTAESGNGFNGGAIYFSPQDDVSAGTDGQLIVDNVVFESNSATGDGGAIYYNSTNIDSYVTNSAFLSNTGNNGGAIAIFNGQLNILSSYFELNQSSGSGGTDGGGGVYVFGANSNVVNSTFFNNTSAKDGGAVYSGNGSSLELIHSTLSENTAQNGSGVRNNGSTVIFNSSIIYGNLGGGNDYDANGGPITTYVNNNIIGTSGVGGTESGPTPLTTDPIFVDLAGDPTTGPVYAVGNQIMFIPSAPDAINNGSVGLMEAAIDQSGAPRGGAAATLGALEINVAPVLTVPASLNAGTGGAAYNSFGAVSFVDADDDGDDFIYDFTITSTYSGIFGNSDGKFDVDTGLSHTSLTGDESNSISISGTLDEINAILATLAVQVGHTDPGPRTFNYTINDNWTGYGGALTDTPVTDPADFGNGTWVISDLDPSDAGGAGSLRAAMDDAFSAGTGTDVFNFLTNNITGTITLASDLPQATNSTGIVIVGSGADNLTIDAGNNVFIDHNHVGRDVNISNISITNASNDFGGAIRMENGNNFNLSGVSIENSTATNEGGAIYLSNLTGTTSKIENSYIGGNTATNGLGGGIFATITGASSLDIVQSTFAGNSAPTAAQDGGGMHLNGNGFFNLSHVTSNGNSAADAGSGLFAGSGAQLLLEYSILNDGTYLEGSVEGNANNATSIVNLEGTSETDFPSNGSVIYTTTDFTLGTPADNGGATKTILVGGTDAVNNAFSSVASFDQIGQSISGTPTLGALEVNADPTITVPVTNPSTSGTTAINLALGVEDTDFNEIKVTITATNSQAPDLTDVGVFSFNGATTGTTISGAGTSSLTIYGGELDVDNALSVLEYDPQGKAGLFTIDVTASDDPADTDLNNAVVVNEIGGDNTTTDSFTVEVSGTFTLSEPVTADQIIAAINSANATAGADVIDLTGITNPTSVTGLPAITSSLQILGPGADLLTIQGASPAYQVTTDDTDLQLSDMTITGGTSDTGTFPRGNGILFQPDGAGSGNGGKMQLDRVRIEGNGDANTGQGGGIYYESNEAGSALVGNSYINQSLIIGNRANNGAGIYMAQGILEIINSTVADNLASEGIVLNNGQLSFNHVTLTGNANNGIRVNNGTLLSEYSILYGNTGTDLAQFGGVVDFGPNSPGAANAPDATDNIVGSSTIVLFRDQGFVVSTDPAFGTFTTNGDHTDTYPPTDAAAVNASVNGTVSSESFDQTGAARTGARTLGSLEVNAAPTGSDFTVVVGVDRVATIATADFSYSDGDGDAFSSIEITSGATGLFLDGNDNGVNDGEDFTGVMGIGDLNLNRLKYEGTSTAGTASFTVKLSDGTDQSPDYTVTLETVENALDFDGTDDDISSAFNAALNFERTDAFTVEAWIKAPGGTTQQIIGNRLGAGNGEGWALGIGGGNDRVTLQLVNTNATNNLVVGSTNDVADGTWHHVVATYDGSETPTGIRIFVDGVEEVRDIQANTLSGNISNGNGTYVGSRSGTDRFYTGQIDEIRVWNDVRTPEQIRANASQHFADPTSEANLVLYYDFNQGIPDGTNTGLTTLTDQSTSNNDGTLNGFGLSGGAASNYTGSTAFVSTAATTGRIAVRQGGTPNPSDGTLFPSGGTAYDYMSVSVGGTSDVDFDIVNEGLGDLTLDGNPTLGTGTDYNLVSPYSLGVVVGPGSSQTLTVQFNPQSVGAGNLDDVDIPSDDPDYLATEYDLNLTGEGDGTPYIDDITWLDANPQDGDIDQVQITFTAPVDFTDGDGGGPLGLDALVFSDANTVTNIDYSVGAFDNVTTVTLNLTSIYTGTAAPAGVTINYQSGGNSSINAVIGGVEIPDGEVTTNGGTYTDGAAPILLTPGSTPNDGNTAVTATPGNLTLQFSEDINLATGNVVLNYVNGDVKETITEASMADLGSSIQVPYGSLDDIPGSSIEFYVEIDDALVNDGVNDYVYANDPDVLNFATAGNPTMIVDYLDENPQDGDIDRVRIVFTHEITIASNPGNGAAADDPSNAITGVILETVDYDDAAYQNVSDITFDLNSGTGIINGTADPGVTISYVQGQEILINSVISGSEFPAVSAAIYNDEAEPVALSITPSPTIITDVTLLSNPNAFDIEVVYSESLNTGTNPVISFPVENPTADLTPNASGFTTTNFTNDTFTQSYDVVDNNTTLPNIDIDVDGADVPSGPNQSTTWGVSDAFSIQTGAMAPTIIAAHFFDTDDDGVIDEMVVELSEEVDETSADINDFSLTGGGGAESIDAVSTVASTNVGNALDATDNDEYVTFEVSNITVGTAITGLAVTFTKDNDGNDFESEATGLPAADNADVSEVDAAAPVIISTTSVNNTYLQISFSEPVWTDFPNTTFLTAADFGLTVTGGTAGGASIVDVKNGTATDIGDPVGLSGGEESYAVFYTLTSNADGTEVISIDTDGSSGNNVFDAAGLAASQNQFSPNNEDNLISSTAITISIAKWLDQDGDGNIDAVELTFNVDYKIDDAGNGSVDNTDGFTAIVIQSTDATSPHTINGGLYDVGGSGNSSAIPYIFPFSADPISGTGIDGLTVTYDRASDDRITSASNSEIPDGQTPAGLQDGAAPNLDNLTQVELIGPGILRVYMQDEIDDSTVDGLDFTYNGVQASASAINQNNSDRYFDLDFGSSATVVEGDLVFSNTSSGTFSDVGGNVLDLGSQTLPFTFTAGNIDDLAAPEIVSIETQDLGGHPQNPTGPNGRIDNIKLTLTEDVIGTVDASDFSLNLGYTITAANETSPGVIDLTVDEITSGFDVDVTPSLTINPGSGITDISTNEIGTSTTLSTDKVGPFAQIVSDLGFLGAPDDDYYDFTTPNSEGSLNVNVTGTVTMPASLVFVEVGSEGKVAIPDGGGNWSVNIDFPDVGTYDVEVTTFDGDGNIGSDGSISEIEIDAASAVAITQLSAPQVCIDQGFVPLGDLVFTENAAGNFGVQGEGAGTGDDTFMMIQLPNDFFFDTGITPTVTVGGGTEITCYTNYVGNAIIQLNFEVTGTSEFNSLTISGLQVRAEGTASGGLVNAVRFAGDADIFGASTNGQVFGTMESFEPPVQIPDVLTAGGASVTEFASLSGDNFSFDPTDAGGTVNWYQLPDDMVVDFNGTVTQATPGFNTAVGLHSYNITEDNGTCEGDALTFNHLIYTYTDDSPVPNFTAGRTFNVTDPSENIIFSNPAGHIVTVTGAGIVATNSPGNGTIVATFDPGTATVGSHTISYSVTNLAGETYVLQSTFDVVAASVFVDGGVITVNGTPGQTPDTDYCEVDVLSINIDLSEVTSAYPPGYYFHKLSYFNGTTSFPVGFTPPADTGGGPDVYYSPVDGSTRPSSTGTPQTEHNTETSWQIDLSTLPTGYTEIYMEVADGTDVQDYRLLFGFEIEPLPTVALNFANSWCVDDNNDYFIEASVNAVAGNISNGYVIEESDGFGGWINPVVVNQAGDDTFNPSDYVAGDYRIIYQTDAQPDAGCTNIDVVPFTINPVPTDPELWTAHGAMGGDGWIDTTDPANGFDSYVLEYCNTIPGFFIGLNSTNVFKWYNDNLDLLATNWFISTSQAFDDPNTGAVENASVGTETVFYFSKVENGCETALRKFTVYIYEETDVPTATTTANNEEVEIDSRYVYEYCDTYTAIDLNVLDGSLSNPNSRNESAYFRLYDANKALQGPLNNSTLDAADFGLGAGAQDTTIYISQVWNDALAAPANPSAFRGCESDLVQFDIKVFDTPLDPTIAVDFPGLAGGTVHICEGDIFSNITNTATGIDEYVWYEDTDPTAGVTLVEIATVSSGSFMSSTNLEAISSFYDNDVTGSYDFQISRVANISDETDFVGCESGLMTLTIEVHEVIGDEGDDDWPAIASTEYGSLDFGDGTPGDAGADYIYPVCISELDPNAVLTASSAYAAGPKEFVWYRSNASFATQTNPLVATAPTFDDLGMGSGDILSAQSKYFIVTQRTDIDDFAAGAACESISQTFVEVRFSDLGALSVTSTTGSGPEYCHDEADDVLVLNVGGTPVNALLGPPPGDADNDVVWEIYADGTILPSIPIDNGIGYPTLDLDALFTAMSGVTPNTPGNEVKLDVYLIYTDPQTNCSATLLHDITIHPSPDITFTINNNDTDNVEFCYDDGLVNLAGFYSDLSNLDLVNGTGSFSGAGINNTSNGFATFNPSGAHGGDPFAVQSSHTINFTYTDRFDCQTVFSKTLLVNPRPEPVGTEDVNQIQFNQICNDDALSTEAYIEMIDPADGVTVLTDYTGYTFVWSVNGGFGQIIMNDNQHSINLPSADDLSYQVTITDTNGCTVTLNETHSKQPLPILDIVGLTDNEEFCSDDTEPAISLTDDGAATALIDVQSWSVDSYDTDDPGTFTQVAVDADGNSLPVLDFGNWHEMAGGNTYVGGQSVGGPSTVHTITIVYIDPNRSYQGTNTTCEATYTETFVVNPSPNIDFEVNFLADASGSFGGDAGYTENFCYDFGLINLQGILRDANGNSIDLPAGTGSFSGLGVIPTGNGLATWNPQTANGNDPHALDADGVDITFTFTDANGCQNTVVRTLFVDPIPDPVEFGPDNDQIQFAEICADSPIEASVQIYEPGTTNIITDYTDYEFDWTIGSLVAGTLVEGSTPTTKNRVTFQSSITNASSNHDFNISVIVTRADDSGNGQECFIEIEEEHEISELPEVIFTEINDLTDNEIARNDFDDASVFCWEEGTLKLDLETVDGANNSVSIESVLGNQSNLFYTIDSYRYSGETVDAGSLVSGTRTAGNPTLDFSALHELIGMEIGGDTSIHVITMEYTDPDEFQYQGVNTMCMNSNTTAIIIYPRPDITFSVGGVDINDAGFEGTAGDMSPDEFCFGDSSVPLIGSFIGFGDESTVQSGVFSGPGVALGVKNQGTFNPSTAHAGGQFAARTGYDITYSVIDFNGCTHSVTKTVYVNPSPEPVEIVGGPQAEDGIHFDYNLNMAPAICEDSPLNPFVEIVGVTDYTDWNFVWDLPNDATDYTGTLTSTPEAAIVSLTGTNEVTFSSNTANFTISVVVTNPLTGCQITISEDHRQQELPSVIIDNISDNEVICSEDDSREIFTHTFVRNNQEVTIGADADTDIADLSWRLTSYLEGDLDNSTAFSNTTGSNPIFDFDALHVNATGSLVGGLRTVHDLVVTYTDFSDNEYQNLATGCTNVDSIRFYIYPDPDLSIQIVNDEISYDLSDDAADYKLAADGADDYLNTSPTNAGLLDVSEVANHFCYDDDEIPLTGVFGPDTRDIITYNIARAVGSFVSSPVPGAVTANGDNKALFDPVEAHGVDPYAVTSKHTITFNYTDEFGCQNSISTDVYVHPRPDAIEVVETPNNGPNTANNDPLENGDQIKFSAICVESPITARVELLDPVTGMEVTDYSGYTFDWTLPFGAFDIAQTPGSNEITYSSTIPNTQSNKLFNISVDISLDKTGCLTSISETHELQSLPVLEFSQLVPATSSFSNFSNQNRFCSEDTDVTLSMTTSTQRGSLEDQIIGTDPFTDISGLTYEVSSYLNGNPSNRVTKSGSGNPMIDMDTWHTDVPGAMLVGGQFTVHEITMTYVDLNDNTYQTDSNDGDNDIYTNCESTVYALVTIYPDPDLTFTITNNQEVHDVQTGEDSQGNSTFLGDVQSDVRTSADHFCYDDDPILLEGLFGQETKDIAGYDIADGDGTFSSTSAPNAIVISQGQPAFDPTLAHGADAFAPRSMHDIIFTYVDDFGCENSISTTVYVNPRPLAEDLGGIIEQIQFDALCLEAPKQASVVLYEPGTATEVSTYDNYTFIWTVPQGSYNDLDGNGVRASDGSEDIDPREVSVANNNTIEFSNDLLLFDIKVEVVNELTGCSVSITENERQGFPPEPSFTYVGITENSADGLDIFIHEDNPSLNIEDQDQGLTYVEFNLYNEGDLGGTPVRAFTNTATGYDTPNDELIWDDPLFRVFDDDKDVPTTVDEPSITITNLPAGKYETELIMRTEKGCDILAETRIITILPVIDVGDPKFGYSENFNEGDAGGWYVEIASEDGKSDDRLSSWELVGAAGVNYNPDASFTANAPSGLYPNQINPMDFDSNDGGGYFVTDWDSTYYANEISFVYSPAFDISEFENPALSFEFWRDFDSQRDGLVVQVSADDGRTWIELGDNDLTSGVNWYTHQGISAGPGETGRYPETSTQTPPNLPNAIAVGYASSEADVLDGLSWKEARHAINEGDPINNLVRFRMALSAGGGEKFTSGQDGGVERVTKIADGFAFDDFRIYEKNKTVLVEQFSTTLPQGSVEPQRSRSKRNAFYIQNGNKEDGNTGLPETPLRHASVWDEGTVGLMINYYTDFYNDEVAGISDQLNARNKVDPATRATYYGVSDVPETRVAGELVPYDIDFNAEDFGNGFDAISLESPDFLIVDEDFTVEIGDTDVLSGSVKFESTIESEEDVEMLFFVGVVEKRIPAISSHLLPQSDPRYRPEGDAEHMYGIDNPNSLFVDEVDTAYHVLRKLLPGPSGWYYKGPLQEEQDVFGSLDFRFDWTISGIYNEEEMRVIAFVQYYNHPQKGNSVEQSNFIDLFDKQNVEVGIQEELAKHGYDIYPNPSDEVLNLELKDIPNEDVYYKISDQAGREVIRGMVHRGAKSSLPIDTSDLPSGLYIIQLHSEERNYRPRKVLIKH